MEKSHYQVSWAVHWYTCDPGNRGRSPRPARKFPTPEQAFEFRDRLVRLADMEEDMTAEERQWWSDEITDYGAGYFRGDVTVTYHSAPLVLWSQFPGASHEV